MREGARAETERALKPHSRGGGSGLGQPGSADLSEERKGSGVGAMESGAMESGERPAGIWRLDAGLGCPWRPIVRPAALVGCAPGLRGSGVPGPFGGGLGVSPGVYLGGLLGGRLGLDSFGQLWEGSTEPAGF